MTPDRKSPAAITMPVLRAFPADPQPGLPTHIEVGSSYLNASEVSSLTIADAWILCEQDETTFFQLIDQIAVGAAAYFAMPPRTREELQSIRLHILEDAEFDDRILLGEDIANLLHRKKSPFKLRDTMLKGNDGIRGTSKAETPAWSIEELETATVKQAWLLTGKSYNEFHRMLQLLAIRKDPFWADRIVPDVIHLCEEDLNQSLSGIFDSVMSAKIAEFGDWRFLTTAQIVRLGFHWNEGGGDAGKFMVRAIARDGTIELPETDRGLDLVYKRLSKLTLALPERALYQLAEQAIRETLSPATMPAAIVAEWNKTRSTSNHTSLCHAPSSSMYFGRDGLVNACCYTRANPLGSYPAQSIEQIWFGPRRAKMRDQLGHNVLPMGCDICAEQLIAHNFKGVLATNFDALAPTDQFSFASKPTLLQKIFNKPSNTLPERTYPTQLEFELSNKCNLECAMCNGFFSSSIRANRENLPPLPVVYDSAFVEQLKPFIPHLKRAKFLGGEPFLIDIYYDIWDFFIQLNPTCELSITTNAAVLTAKALRIIETLNCQIIVSFDGITKATYESIRVNATFERTLENLEAIVAINHRKGKQTTLAVCPMVSNWREVPEIIQFANQRGATVFLNTVIFPISASLKYLPSAQQGLVIDFYRTALPQPQTTCEAENFRALEDLARQIESWRHESPETSELLPILA